MKTLVRSQVNPIIAISSGRPLQKKIRQNQKNNFILKKNISYLFLLFSFSIFLFLPESPKLSESICISYNSELVCNVW